MPLAYELIHADVRRALTKQFPYAVFFVVEEDELRVIPVMHARRSPREWRRRL